MHDVRTPMGFFTGGDLDLPPGRLEDTLDWWVVLRSLLDERPVHTPGDIEVPDHRTFTPARRPMPICRRFLHQAGYLHVAGLFTEDRDGRGVGRHGRGGPRLPPRRRLLVVGPHGRRRASASCACSASRSVPPPPAPCSPTRVSPASAPSPATATSLVAEEKAGNLIEALVKPVGIVEGISDVPWHKDCSLGGHSYRCCSLTVGISVTGADATSGQLRVVAGSHRALIQPAFVRRRLDLPQRDLPTGTGDVTVHLSCTLHMSQPPVDRERRVLYTSSRLPDPDGNAMVGRETPVTHPRRRPPHGLPATGPRRLSRQAAARSRA